MPHARILSTVVPLAIPFTSTFAPHYCTVHKKVFLLLFLKRMLSLSDVARDTVLRLILALPHPFKIQSQNIALYALFVHVFLYMCPKHVLNQVSASYYYMLSNP